LRRSAALRAASPHDEHVPDHDDVRRLAQWLSRRREVDEVMEVLTQYGPTANERVAAHLDALQAMLAAEAEAFARYAAQAPELPQKPLPAVLPADDDDAVPSNVHTLSVARAAKLTSPH
jgi:hypothetical protein